MKICSKCHKLLDESCFYKRKDSLDGLTGQCKECISEYSKEHTKKTVKQRQQYYQNNIEYRKAWQREYNKTHKEQRAEYTRQNREHKLVYDREYNKTHKEQRNNYSREFREKHKEYFKNYNKIYRENNREYYKEYDRQRQIENQENPMFKLNKIMSNGICYSLKGAKAERHWETLVPYTLEDLKEHIEKQFDKNMSWSNIGTYWELDHIIPKNTFNFVSTEDKEFQICWSLANLRPLEKIANRSRPKDGRDISQDIKNKILSQNIKEKVTMYIA